MIYLENKSGGWLYFKIKRGQMGITSSVPDIYNTISMLKDGDRVYREGKIPVFEFMPADISMRDNFVARMEDFKERFKVGSNISTPVTPAEPAPVIQSIAAPEQKTVTPEIPNEDFLTGVFLIVVVFLIAIVIKFIYLGTFTYLDIIYINLFFSF